MVLHVMIRPLEDVVNSPRRVAIALSTYNPNLTYLNQQIDSLLAQTCKPILALGMTVRTTRMSLTIFAKLRNVPIHRCRLSLAKMKDS